MRKNKGMQRNLFIIGNINSGKSTLIQALSDALRKFNQKFVHDPFDKIMRKNLEEIKASKHLDVDQKLALTCSVVPQSTLAVKRIKMPRIGNLCLKLSSQQLSNIILVPFFAMALTGISGPLMEVRLDLLFYLLIVLSLALWIDIFAVFKRM